jgi:hypothetical protein
MKATSETPKAAATVQNTTPPQDQGTAKSNKAVKPSTEYSRAEYPEFSLEISLIKLLTNSLN